MTVPSTPELTRVSRGWTARFGLIWLGVWIAMLVPVSLALPDQLATVDHAHRYRNFGLINALVGLAALVSLPLFGAMCDRTNSRFGHRKAWVLGGVVAMVVGLILTGRQDTWQMIAFWWIVANLGNSAIATGLTASVADQVPDDQRGTISGFMYGTQGLGIVVGMVAVEGFEAATRYVLLAIALVLCALPYLVVNRDVEPSAGTEPLTLKRILSNMWISPRRYPDFGWAFGSRLLVNVGNALGTTYLWFFLRDGLKVEDPDGTLITVTVIYLVATLIATFVAGPVSDRTGRRRIFVGVAAGLQAVAGVLVAAAPSVGMLMVAAAFIGAGYGAFVAVDQALVTAVLPNADDRAKDLGILNVGAAVPQGLGPLAAAGITTAFGFSPLFLAAGLSTAVGALMVSRVRSVR